MSVFCVFFGTAVFIIASAFAALADAPRLALVVTNQAYPATIGALENTHRDGERMAAALTALGFAVVHKRDLDKTSMVSEVSDYVVRLEKAGPEAAGFFYYAGHGAASSKYGENYLIPVAAPITSDTQFPLQAVKFGEIIDAVTATSAKANFLVFDACRNVPIGFSVRSAERGLRAEVHRENALVAFATAPGTTATDEGVYAEALAEEMQKPGVLATEVFRAVLSRVLSATANRQHPWIVDGLIKNMSFMPPTQGKNQVTKVEPGNPAGGHVSPGSFDHDADSDHLDMTPPDEHKINRPQELQSLCEPGGIEQERALQDRLPGILSKGAFAGFRQSELRDQSKRREYRE